MLHVRVYAWSKSELLKRRHNLYSTSLLLYEEESCGAQVPGKYTPCWLGGLSCVLELCALCSLVTESRATLAGGGCLAAA